MNAYYTSISEKPFFVFGPGIVLNVDSMVESMESKTPSEHIWPGSKSLVG